MEKEAYFLTVGLEVHAELSTKSKMWCGCKNDPEEKTPNLNICPVCTASPGSLPVPNKEAILKVIKVGLALGGTIAKWSEFDRKNYFYPDIPKGYQISQYKYPIVSGGSLNDVAITRVHLEEDTARSMHDKGADTLVDFNRAGVPLMELVTEPVIHDAKTAGDFARELQLLLKTLHISEANMEKGQMRVEANISVSKEKGVFGTKVEVKNINSFRAVERAIAYEMNRHIEAIEKGEIIKQETRGWDENKGITFSQRSKENAQDYRYFPDPDLPKLELFDAFDLDEVRKNMEELPEAKRTRYEKEYALRKETTEILVNDPVLASYFETVAKKLPKEHVQIAGNYIAGDLIGLLKKEGKDISVESLPVSSFVCELMELTVSGDISSRTSKDLLALLVIGTLKDSPKKYAEAHDLLQKNDESLLQVIVRETVAENPDAVSQFKQGKETIVMFLVGQCMKKAKGSGNPALFQKLLREELVK